MTRGKLFKVMSRNSLRFSPLSQVLLSSLLCFVHRIVSSFIIAISFLLHVLAVPGSSLHVCEEWTKKNMLKTHRTRWTVSKAPVEGRDIIFVDIPTCSSFSGAWVGPVQVVREDTAVRILCWARVRTHDFRCRQCTFLHTCRRSLRAATLPSLSKVGCSCRHGTTMALIPHADWLNHDLCDYCFADSSI